MKKILKVIPIIGVFIILLAMNLSVISGSKRNPTLNNLSIKSLMKTAIADGEACVFTNFANPATLATEILLCYDKCGELCGIQQCCIFDLGGGPCTETICMY